MTTIVRNKSFDFLRRADGALEFEENDIDVNAGHFVELGYWAFLCIPNDAGNVFGVSLNFITYNELDR